MSSAFIAAVLVFAWIGIHNLAGFIVFCALYGFTSAIIVTLPAAVVPWLSPSMDVIGTRLGMGWFPVGISVLVGSPIAAAAANIPEDDFLGMQLFSGIMMAAGGCLFVVPLLHIRKKRREKGLKGFA
jgi:MFS family permease